MAMQPADLQMRRAWCVRIVCAPAFEEGLGACIPAGQGQGHAGCLRLLLSPGSLPALYLSVKQRISASLYRHAQAIWREDKALAGNDAGGNAARSAPPLHAFFPACLRLTVDQW